MTYFESLVVPSFPHGETLNSFLFRCAGLNGGRSLRQECMRLGRANKSLDCLPSSVPQFCEAFDSRFGNEDEVLRNHTLFPFYRCGLSPDGSGAFMKRLTSQCRGPVRPARLPVLLSPAERGCLSCPECDAENELKLGFSFDHRSHAIPFIHVCPVHGIELVRGDGKNALTFHTQCRKTNPGLARLLLEYATRANETVAGGADANSKYAKSSVIVQLKQAGCIGESGRWALSQLFASFHTLFDDAFADERLRCLCQSDKYISNAVCALQRDDRGVHPVWCILFRWLADMVEFKKPREMVRRRPKLAIPDEQTIRDALASCSTLTHAARMLGQDVSTISHLARSHAIEYQTRTKTVTGEVLAEVRKRLDAGDSTKKIATDCNVSLSTVYRVRRTRADVFGALRERRMKQKVEILRATWRDVVEQAPHCSITEIRRRNAALWTYLYRHDRDWLA
jgi:Tn7-like transposition protein D/TniQ/Helix-turn-helix domain of resolvase